LFVVFLYGAAVGKYEVFPHAYLRSAKDAVDAVIEAYTPPEPDEFKTHRTSGGVKVWDRSAAVDGVTLLALRRNNSMVATLIDMDGRELHRWEIPFSSVWPEAPHLLYQAPDSDISWHGIHLFGNGDLLLNFEGGNFPGGGGLVLIDRDSKPRWSLGRNTHHDLEVQPDGGIVVTAHDYREEGVEACSRFLVPPYYEDALLIVSTEGADRLDRRKGAGSDLRVGGALQIAVPFGADANGALHLWARVQDRLPRPVAPQQCQRAARIAR
jgi:hypothetical protein